MLQWVLIIIHQPTDQPNSPTHPSPKSDSAACPWDAPTGDGCSQPISFKLRLGGIEAGKPPPLIGGADGVVHPVMVDDMGYLAMLDK